MTHRGNQSFPEFVEAIAQLKSELVSEELAKEFIKKYQSSSKTRHRKYVTILKKLIDPDTDKKEKEEIFDCAELLNSQKF